jgi:hypothetical protein
MQILQKAEKNDRCKISKLNPPITGLLEDFMQERKNATLVKNSKLNKKSETRSYDRTIHFNKDTNPAFPKQICPHLVFLRFRMRIIIIAFLMLI